MKAMCKKAESNRARIEHEERERKRKEFLDGLSEDERHEFLIKEKERQSKALKMASTIAGIVATLGIDNTYGGMK